MHRSHRFNAAAHTPYVRDTPMYAVMLWPVMFVGACRPYFPACQIYFHTYVPRLTSIPVFFCVVTWSTDHRSDNQNNSAQSVLTSSILQHHHPAQQQQQWAHLARMDDRTAGIEIISIDHLTMPRPHYHHLFPCCFFCILLCVIKHCHCSSCGQRCAPTAAGRVLCARGRSTQYGQYWCSLLLSSVLANARTFRNV